MTHHVVVLLIDRALPLDLGIPLQVFGRADMPQYTLTTASNGAAPVRVMGGMTITAAAGLEAFDGADTIIVPGFEHGSVRVPAAVLRALRVASDRGVRMVSICSGAFALAEAGILDGRTATTHWSSCAELAERFPAITVDANVLFVDEGRVLTSAGVAAGIDLSLHIVRRDLGAAVANRLAKRIVAAPRREGKQAQFIELPGENLGAATQTLSATREWMLSRLREPLMIAQMAGHARMSTRGFARHFAAQTGMSPLRWLHAQRIELAKALLETSELGIDEVAGRCGLGSAANFRSHFKRATSLTPQGYRRAFSAAVA